MNIQYNTNYELIESPDFNSFKAEFLKLWEQYQNKRYYSSLDLHLKLIRYYCAIAGEYGSPIDISIHKKQGVRSILKVLSRADKIDLKIASQNRKHVQSSFRPLDSDFFKYPKGFTLSAPTQNTVDDSPLIEVDIAEARSDWNTKSKVKLYKTVTSEEHLKEFGAKVMEKQNSILAKEDIAIGTVKLNPILCRKYKHINYEKRGIDKGIMEFQCGRIYAKSGDYQTISSDLRSKIKFNGNKSVELDYKALHPSILYAKKGLNIPNDCYAIEGFSRKDVKAGMLRAVSSSNKHLAVSSLVYNERIKRPLAIELLNAIEEKHAPIKDMFYEYLGCELQLTDSDLIMDVMRAANKKGIPILPIHDSIVIPVDWKEWGIDIMKKAFKERFNADIDVSCGTDTVVVEENTVENVTIDPVEIDQDVINEIEDDITTTITDGISVELDADTEQRNVPPPLEGEADDELLKELESMIEETDIEKIQKVA